MKYTENILYSKPLIKIHVANICHIMCIYSAVKSMECYASLKLTGWNLHHTEQKIVYFNFKLIPSKCILYFDECDNLFETLIMISFFLLSFTFITLRKKTLF